MRSRARRRRSFARVDDGWMSKKNNRVTAAKRVADAKARELEILRKKEEKRLRRAAAAERHAPSAMAIDGAREKGRPAVARVKNVIVAASLRAVGGVVKRREGKGGKKMVRGVLVGKARLRKNDVVRGIKIVDAATKQAALDAIAETQGARVSMA